MGRCNHLKGLCWVTVGDVRVVMVGGGRFVRCKPFIYEARESSPVP